MIAESRLMAYVDGELDAQSAREVEAAMAADAELAALVERHRRLRAAAHEAFAGVLDEPVPSRLSQAAAAAPARRLSGPPSWAALAATLLVGVIGGGALGAYLDRPARGAGDPLALHGALAEALTTQPAARSAAAPIKVGLSFRDREGRYCRTFAYPGRKLAGLACRDGDGWAARVAVAYAPAETEFQMAASDVPGAVLQAVDSLIEGEPLGPEAEAAAIARGWRD